MCEHLSSRTGLSLKQQRAGAARVDSVDDGGVVRVSSAAAGAATVRLGVDPVEALSHPGADVGRRGVAGVEVSDAVVDPVLEILALVAPSVDERLLNGRQDERIVCALGDQDGSVDDRRPGAVVREDRRPGFDVPRWVLEKLILSSSASGTTAIICCVFWMQSSAIRSMTGIA